MTLLMFQSTPSGGKATVRTAKEAQMIDVSIHAFRGEGDAEVLPELQMTTVSIHAFRGEGDSLLRVDRCTVS